MDPISKHLLEVQTTQEMIPEAHKKYLRTMERCGIKPKVIYDIGACVLHWTRSAKTVWPEAEYILFDAFGEAEFLYKDYQHHIGVLGDIDGREVKWYQNELIPNGNSYYKENNDGIFPEDKFTMKCLSTLDAVVKARNFPLPDLIKIDVQGAELDVLKGASEILRHTKHLIVELQHVDYNRGALQFSESIPIIEKMGFKLITPLFASNGPDGDYHFMNVSEMTPAIVRQIANLSPNIYNVKLSNGNRDHIVEYIKSQKAKGKFTVIDVGGSRVGWSKDVVDAILDFNENDYSSTIRFFKCDITNADAWDEIMKYVTIHGKFDFCICTHTIEDIMNPVFVCEQICKIAKEGYMAFPSKYRELARVESTHWRGYIHHRWIFDVKNNSVIGYPKINMTEHAFFDTIADPSPDKLDMSFFWKESIDIKYLNNNYLGPDAKSVLEYYEKLKDTAE